MTRLTGTHPPGPLARARLALTLIIAAQALAACDNPYDIDWSYAVPDTVTLYSLSRGEYVGYPSVFDFVGGFTWAIEAIDIAGGWDLGFVEDKAGASFLMAGAIDGYPPQAMMQAMPGYSFDELVRAPAAGYDSALVALHIGTVYALRTRNVTDGYGNTCRYAAKLEPLELDTVRGILRFHYLRNPNCGSRDLVP